VTKLTEADKMARRNQITSAALRCFAREGFHRTSMADIVRESKLSPGAIYHYFTGKDEVIEAIAADRHEHEAALNRAALSEPDPLRALHRLVENYGAWLADPDERMRRRVGVQIWAEALRNDAVHQLVKGGTEAARHAITELLIRARNEGRLRDESDPAALARVFVALFQGFILQLSWDEDIDMNGYLAEVDRLMHLLVVEPAHSTRGGL
jgi:AcrR family transcriptional regulator